MPMGTRADFTALECAGLKCETTVYLVEVARQQRTVYYKDVAQQFKDRRLDHKSEAMVDLLGEISAEEHAAGRPLLSAVVVRNDPELPIPGRGFFRLARNLGSMSKTADKVVFWKAELQRVCKYPWP
jgi:hypothetical protein